MKIENLEEGMVLKNYRELCKVLEMEVKGGNSKKAQLRELNSFVDIRKHDKGNSFTVEEIYEQQKLNLNTVTDGNNSVYSKDIQVLIINLLAKSDRKIELISITQLLKMIQMVNQNYNRSNWSIHQLHKETKIDKSLINEFYSETQTTLKSYVETALNALRRKALIIWSKEVVVSIDDYEHRRATKEEKEIILSTERETLQEMGLKDFKGAFLTGQWNKFKKNVNRVLYDECEIRYYYESYSIVYNREDVIDELDSMERERIECELNERVVTQLKSTSKTKHLTSTQKQSEGKASRLDFERLKLDYVLNSSVLVDRVVKLDTIRTKKD